MLYEMIESSLTDSGVHVTDSLIYDISNHRRKLLDFNKITAHFADYEYENVVAASMLAAWVITHKDSYPIHLAYTRAIKNLGERMLDAMMRIGFGGNGSVEFMSKFLKFCARINATMPKDDVEYILRNGCNDDYRKRIACRMIAGSSND